MVSIGLSGGLSGGGGIRESLHTGNLCLDCLGGALPHKDGMAVGRGSGLQRTIGGSAGLGCSYGVDCNFGLIVFLLAPALPHPFLGSMSGIIL